MTFPLKNGIDCCIISPIYVDRKDDRMTIDRRSDGDLAITDRSFELRRRKREILHIIHNTTWIMESLSLVIGLFFLQHLCPEINPEICANLVFIHNLFSAKTLVPFTHLFNEHRIKVMVLERGWIFAIKNALQFNIVPRVAPESNLLAQNPENNGRRSKRINVSIEILRKYQKQECVHLPGSSPEASTKNKITEGSDIIKKHDSDLPNQV